MTHTYQIKGMTCNGCVAKVKSELLKLKDIESADVQLSARQATITMANHIPLETLQHTLSKACNFTIQADKNHLHNSAETTQTKTWVQTYKPLFLIFSYITGITLFTSLHNEIVIWQQWMNHFMAGFFIVFSFFKLLDIKGFANSYSSYDLLAKKLYSYGLIYPFIELALGIAYVFNWQPLYTNIATIIVMGFSCIGVIQTVLQKRKIQCACLGSVFNLPMSTVTILEDILMVTMAGIALVQAQIKILIILP